MIFKQAAIFVFQLFVLLFVQRELHFSWYPILSAPTPPQKWERGQTLGASCICVSRGIAMCTPQIN
jgi:hypothetical protein